MVMIEFDSGIRWSPGRFRSTIGGRKFRRFWWLWFAVTWFAGDLKEYGDVLRSGTVEWITRQH